MLENIKHTISKRFVVVCLINFFVASLLGLVLRFSFLHRIPFNYRFLTHAHSHVAMLGWVYLMLFTLMVHYFVPDNKKSRFTKLFWITEIAVVGMMFSFPFQGYAAISISFSTLHILCSYYFAYIIWKHHAIKHQPTRYLFKSSLAFMLVSTLGVWCLGPAVATLGQSSAFYQIAIQFFLHFQFNGWFLMAVIALFFHRIQVNNSKQFKLFFKFLIISTILTFSLPVYWFVPNNLLLIINDLGVLMQLVTLVMFLRLIKPKFLIVLKMESLLTVYLYSFAIFCFILKIVLQALSLYPNFSKVILDHHNFVIGFIHLTMLGVITGFLFSFGFQNIKGVYKKALNVGVLLFVMGFVLTEVMLILQGIKFYYKSGIVTHYYVLLFIFSMLLPAGIGFILFSIIKHDVNARKRAKTS